MSFVELFPYVILGLLGYLMLYAIVDRICKCCEQCAMAKAYGEFVKVEKEGEK